MALAELLVNTRKAEEARAEFTRIAQAHPDAPAPWEALGYIELRRKNREGAAKHFAKAAELGSTNARMYYEWSWTLEETEDSFGPILRALRKAVELDPDSFDALFRLGSHLLRHQRYGDALATLRRIKRVEPANAVRLFVAMGYCLDRLNQPEEALGHAMQAKQHAQKPGEIAEVERLLEYLTRPKAPVVAGGREEAGVGQPAGPGGVVEESEERPVLKRTLVVRVAGKFRNLECLGAQAKLHLTTADGDLVLWIAEPDRVSLRGIGAASTELVCGPQPGREVEVGYTAEENAERGTRGTVRSIEFR
jgi:tetratricopeptide (TPR) repeat protein